MSVGFTFPDVFLLPPGCSPDRDGGRWMVEQFREFGELPTEVHFFEIGYRRWAVEASWANGGPVQHPTTGAKLESDSR